MKTVTGITEQANRPRVAIYTRSASEFSRPTSIDDQILCCREAAAEKGWTVEEGFIRHDGGFPGISRDRVGLNSLIDDAKILPRPYDILLIHETDRIARNTKIVLKVCDDLERHGVGVYFTALNLDSRDINFRMLLTFTQMIYEQRDEQYSKSLGQKVKNGMRGRFLAGYNPGGSCYGYVNVPEEDPTRKGDYGRPAVNGVHQVIVPEEATIVKRIFEKYANGMSLGGIAGILTAEGVPTSGNPRTKLIAVWHPATIRQMLRNTRYCGKTVYGRTVRVRNPTTGKLVTHHTQESKWERKYHPELRIISDELWIHAQEQLARATRRSESHLPFRVSETVKHECSIGI